MIVIEAANEVSFTKLMKLFESGGKATRRAWGIIIRHKICRRVIPIVAPASHWPRSTELIAARIVSEAYAPVLSEKVMIPAVNGSSLIPWGNIPRILKYGSPKKTINN